MKKIFFIIIANQTVSYSSSAYLELKTSLFPMSLVKNMKL